jgi:hypothetical protein
VSDTITIKFKNWDKYNKRQKDIKRPYWFAMSNEIFLDPFYSDLTDQEKQAFIWLLCEASRQNKYGEVDVSFRLFVLHTGYKRTTLDTTLAKLLKSGRAAGSRQDGGRIATATEQNKTIQEYTMSAQEPDGVSSISEADEGEFNLEAIYEAYPRRKGDQRKQLGLKRLKAIIKTDDDFHLAMRSVKGYKAHLMSQNKVGTEFVKMFSSFWDSLGDWKSWAEKEQRKSGAEITDDLIIKAFGYIPGGVDA